MSVRFFELQASESQDATGEPDPLDPLDSNEVSLPKIILPHDFRLRLGWIFGQIKLNVALLIHHDCCIYIYPLLVSHKSSKTYLAVKSRKSSGVFLLTNKHFPFPPPASGSDSTR